MIRSVGMASPRSGKATAGLVARRLSRSPGVDDERLIRARALVITCLPRRSRRRGHPRCASGRQSDRLANDSAMVPPEAADETARTEGVSDGDVQRSPLRNSSANPVSFSAACRNVGR